jgi:2-methylisocitrate lyase-like PEP mutase family enzyme
MDEKSQQDFARKFSALHERGTFVIANCFDGGSARVLGSLGFQALATSSAAAAATYGRQDGQITRDEALAHAGIICAASTLPVSADLENGFGPMPEDTALTIELAAGVGLVGGSIEDTTGNPEQPIFDFTLAVERIAAAVEAARELNFPFTLTARTENFLNGRPDLDDTIRRLQAFEKAGADVLFAPGLPSLDAVRTVCASVRKPVNFMVAIPGKSFSVTELAAAGVRRISLATTMYRAAMTGLVAAAREIADTGTFGYLDRIMPGSQLDDLLAEPRRFPG